MTRVGRVTFCKGIHIGIWERGCMTKGKAGEGEGLAGCCFFVSNILILARLIHGVRG